MKLETLYQGTEAYKILWIVEITLLCDSLYEVETKNFSCGIFSFTFNIRMWLLFIENFVRQTYLLYMVIWLRKKLRENAHFKGKWSLNLRYWFWKNDHNLENQPLPLKVSFMYRMIQVRTAFSIYIFARPPYLLRPSKILMLFKYV